MAETRAERIQRLTEEFRRLVEEKFPRGGSTLAEIEEVTEEIGRQIARKIEKEATEQEGCGYQGLSTPCACGRSARYVRLYAKDWLTLHGLLVIPRAYYHCSHCRKGFAPLDGALGLDRGSTSLLCAG